MQARTRQVLFALMLLSSLPATAQKSWNDWLRLTPESLGLTTRNITTQTGKVEYFVSSDALKSGAKKPLFVFIQGSGFDPLFTAQEQNGRRSADSTLMIRPERVADGFRFVVVSKPGIPFLVRDKFTPPPEYWQKTSLPARADAVSAVIEQLVREPGVDGRRVVVVGHSEGASVAARVAAMNSRVTDVVFLSCGGESQMYDFVIGVRKRQARGELTAEQADREIQKLLQKYREILAAPRSTEKFWKGHTYLRWSTFFQPAVDDLLKTDARVFVGIGTADTNSPIESAEIIPVEFLRAGKHNLTYRTWPGLDHSYVKEVINPDGSRRREDHLNDVLAEVMAWLTERDRPTVERPTP